MVEIDEARAQRILQRRLEAKGLESTPVPGGRAIMATLSVGPQPFETLGHPRQLRAVRFATVGSDRIKCLEPRALFYLPLIRTGGCTTATELEARIRAAWEARIAALRRAAAWLEELGTDAEAPGDTPLLRLPLGLEDGSVAGAVIEPGRVILPGRGPLSGVTLERSEDRVFAPDPRCTSPTELEIAVTDRLEELGHLAERLRQVRQQRTPTLRAPEGPQAIRYVPPILLVGPQLADHRALLESLKVHGFRVGTARSFAEAIDAFHGASFELVVAETRLDRAEGIELVPAVRHVPGIEEVPVLLIDDHHRESRREAARRAGAAGYLVQPVEAKRVASALAQLVHRPRRRRFTRYPRVLSVAWPGCREPGVTSNIARGGMFVRAEGEFPSRTLDRYEIHLPEVASLLCADAEVVYRLAEAGSGQSGAGLRFHTFPDENEKLLIEYLRSLDPDASRP